MRFSKTSTFYPPQSGEAFQPSTQLNPMARVRHTIKYYYGSYSGEAEITCDENDEKETVVALFKKQEGLNFLSMCSEGYKIINTENLNES